MSENIHNYYNILELSPNSSVDEIRKSYHRLAKIWHPDKNYNKELAEKKFKEIKKAYEKLIAFNQKPQRKSDNKENKPKNQQNQNEKQKFKFHSSEIFSDYPIGSQFPSHMNFISRSRFLCGNLFGSNSSFGISCKFGPGNVFNSNNSFGFGSRCYFGPGCMFNGDIAYGSDCIFGIGCK